MLLFIDGFDQYGTDLQSIDNSLQASLYQYSSEVTASAETHLGRGFSAKMIGGPTWGFRRVLNESTMTLTVGFNAMWDVAPRGFKTLVSFENITTLGTVTPQVLVGVGGDGSMVVLTGGGTAGIDALGATIVAQSDRNYFPPSTWCYVEAQVVLTATSIHVVVRVDNNLAVIYDDINMATAPLPITAVFWCAGYDSTELPSLQGNLWIDDMYCCDANGGEYASFITGPITVYTLLPNGDAGPNQMTQDGGTSGHWSSQLGTINDAGADYVWTTALGALERYTLAPPPNDILSILAMSAHVCAERDSELQRRMIISLYLGDGILASAPQPLSTTYSTQQLLAEASPLAGAWQISQISDLIVGFQTALD